jgi:hypothetical protein
MPATTILMRLPLSRRLPRPPSSHSRSRVLGLGHPFLREGGFVMPQVRMGNAVKGLVHPSSCEHSL